MVRDAPEDLERRFAAGAVAGPRSVPIDRRIVEREYQTDCIEILTGAVHRGQRKMLVEIAAGTGETRTASARADNRRNLRLPCLR
ncbi:MAG: hypothetical protein B7Z66_13750 [Chromatiales bacterium 21-64-14]|nr:MAG: hypothetical protein B7Z66_13750 [Chromatiales bacterium 21-64-14]